jgi:hypothetical protein
MAFGEPGVAALRCEPSRIDGEGAVERDVAVFVACFVDAFDHVSGPVGRLKPVAPESGEIGKLGDAVGARGRRISQGLVQGTPKAGAEIRAGGIVGAEHLCEV